MFVYVVMEGERSGRERMTCDDVYAGGRLISTLRAYIHVVLLGTQTAIFYIQMDKKKVASSNR